MLHALGETTYIGTVRARTAERDALALRIRLGRVLGSLSLNPSGVPASAVVCVRRLSAPPLSNAAAGGLRRAVAWDRAVESSLARLVSSAARPARGFVPADAEAVVFFDRAELLACLASDWLAGATARRWWWRGLLKGGDAARSLVAAWLDAPEYVPAALELLARDGRADAFAASLDDASARAVAHAVARAFALEELGDALAREPRAGDDSERGDATAHDDARQQGSHPSPARAPAPPWETRIGGAHAAALGREQECLLGLGLTLARSPAHARTPSFARAVRAWREAAPPAALDAVAPRPPEQRPREETARTDADAHASPSPATRDDGRGETTSSQTLAETRGGEATRRGHVETARDDASVAREASHDSPASDDGRATPLDSSHARADAENESRAGAASQVEEHARVEESATPQPVARTQDVREGTTPVWAAQGEGVEEGWPAEVLPRLVEARAETKLGGLLFLVNVGLFLELYGDFTTPLRPGLALPVWDFVTLLGRRLCADDDGPVDESSAEGSDDPVWSLLARLAGRGEGDEPGRGFEAPDEWRVAREWLAPFPEGSVWEWSDEDGRLRVRHAQGFYVSDVKRRRGVGAPRQLREELAAYEGVSFTLRRVKSVKDADGARAGGLERWMSWLAAYAGARLARALGRESRAESSRLLFRQEASVRVTATHVDAYFQLARLPIEVRLAGLDRDPGWVPAAGRFVAFHFD
ncbi:MAG TPA: hypothetical protein VER32_05945 [Pyrinomonadaceae bacterium]|nr:hypothetical protein [Pyrinomonadaceae bacterium]